MTSAFLAFSKSRGNDLSTPVPELGFPGLKSGHRWRLCAPRWQEAFIANLLDMTKLESGAVTPNDHCYARI
jgi:uncharacterized protein